MKYGEGEKEVIEDLKSARELLQGGKFEEARKILKNIRTKEAYYLMGESYYLQGDAKNALKYFEIAAGMGSLKALDMIKEVRRGEKVSSEQEKDKGNKK